MGLYDSHRRPLAPGDLVFHYDTGHVGFVIGDADTDDSISVFVLSKVRQMFKNSFSRVKD